MHTWTLLRNISSGSRYIHAIYMVSGIDLDWDKAIIFDARSILSDEHNLSMKIHDIAPVIVPFDASGITFNDDYNFDQLCQDVLRSRSIITIEQNRYLELYNILSEYIDRHPVL